MTWQMKSPGYISIHAPRGGSDCLIQFGFCILDDFNPRSPWGERQDKDCILATYGDFNPRSPWGERLPHPVRILHFG